MGISRLGISDTNNTVAQRLVHQSSVKRSYLRRGSGNGKPFGSIPSVIGYSILKYIRLAYGQFAVVGVANLPCLVQRDECISIW